jgi:hypothetical protein
MGISKKTIWAYLAGIIDGEGCVYVYERIVNGIFNSFNFARISYLVER